MLFTSANFFILLFITFFLYYIPILKSVQLKLLIFSSLVFYAYESPAWLLLLLASAGINILTSYNVIFGTNSRKKLVAILGVIFNLLILAFFKYSPLLAKTFLNENNSIGDFLLTIPLPIGVSFFTFEGISLVVDVYKEKYFKDKNSISPSLWQHSQRTLFFISFFPHLISGPILKAHEFLPQIETKLFKNIMWEVCFKNLVIGYFLKTFVADNLKDYTLWIQFPMFLSFSGGKLLILLLAYSFQIFADFAGYSLIAIGLAKLFGYDFIQNFNFPYIATSFADFWQRWHISLSTFLKQYLYIPLGGNRKGNARTYINLMTTMVLGGLWHGAAWSYAIWGAFHGIALVLERLVKDTMQIKTSKVLRFIYGIAVFLFVTIAWILFKLPNFNHVVAFFKTIIQNPDSDYKESLGLTLSVAIYSLPVILFHLYYLIKSNNHFLYVKIKKTEYLMYAAMLFLIITNRGLPGTFIYFQF